jgi:hypothetical protein
MSNISFPANLMNVAAANLVKQGGPQMNMAMQMFGL